MQICEFSYKIFIHLDVYLDPIHYQLPVCLLAQLVERCTGNAEVMGSNPVRAWKNFFQVLFTTTRFSSVLSCEDLLISSLHRSANIWIFIYLKRKRVSQRLLFASQMVCRVTVTHCSLEKPPFFELTMFCTACDSVVDEDANFYKSCGRGTFLNLKCSYLHFL